MSLMLEKLHQAEACLPELIKDIDGWNGIDVLYHEPRVERVWRQWENYRISLHLIHPALRVDCLYHPHPWASGIRVVHGGYEMGIGYGAGVETPPEACRVILTAGSEYCMENKDGWHYVCPTDGINLSVMVSSEPWNREMPVEPEHNENGKLSILRIYEILEMFSLFYKDKN